MTRYDGNKEVLRTLQQNSKIKRRKICQYNKDGKLKLASNAERFCMSKWNDETKDMCWLTEDETEAWLGLIRGLKMMDKMVGEE